MHPGYQRSSFVPLAPVARTSFVLVAHRRTNITTYQDFCRLVQNRPEQFCLGFWHEPTSRVIQRWVELATLPTPVLQSYTGSTTQAEAMNQGHTDFAFDTWVAALANPDLHVLAVLDSASGLDVTCLSDLYPGIDIDNWYGIVAPAGIDPERARILQEIIQQGLLRPEYQKRLQDLAFRPWIGNAEDFEQQQTKTIDFYQKL